MTSQYHLTPEQAIEQDARYFNRQADYDERLANDLDPDRHTPAEFWGANRFVPFVPIVPEPRPSSEALYQAWLAENPDFRAKQQVRDAERARQDKIMKAKWDAEIEKGRADAVRD